VSEPFRIGFTVRELVQTMGHSTEMDSDGNIQGLGLTYGQVVAVVYRMCQQGVIPSKFVLQTPPEMQTIYRQTITMGRPDAPRP